MSWRNMDRAMSIAERHARVQRTHGANHAECIQMRDDLDNLVGRWVDRKLVLPPTIEAAMWRDS